MEEDASPPWPKDVLPTLVSFLPAEDAISVDACAKETQCVVRRRVLLTNVEDDGTRRGRMSLASPSNWDRYEAVPACHLAIGMISKVHSLRMTFSWSDQGVCVCEI